MVPWNPTRTKVQLRLAVQRLRMLQEKKEALAKSSRRDIATLLERGRVETARVKVEAIIGDDIHVELLELLELYCELLLARFGLLELNTREPDKGISEGVSSIIHAAPRTELKELHTLREMLMQKYGREFAVAAMENTGGCVSERVMAKLTFATPPAALVDAYLSEIARGYGLNWAPPPPPEKPDQPNEKPSGDDESGGGGDGGIAASELQAPLLDRPLAAKLRMSASPEAVTPKLPDLPLNEPTRPSSNKGKEPGGVKSNEDKSRSDVDNKLEPGGVDDSSSFPTLPPYTPPAPTFTSKKREEEDDFESLQKRFEALRKR